MNEVLRIMRDEFCDPFKANDVERRIRGAFEYHIRTSYDEFRDSASLTAAMKFFDDKNWISGPWADLGIPTPERFYRGTDSSRTSPPTGPSKSNKVDPAPAVRPKQNDRQSPKDRPRSETTSGAMPTAPGTQQHKPADNGRPPEFRRVDEVRRGSGGPAQVRRGSPDPAANPTAGLPPSGHPATPKSQPISNRPQPVRPPALPSSHPHGKPSPQTAPSKTEHSRGAVKRPGSSPGPLREFVRDLKKKNSKHERQSPRLLNPQITKVTWRLTSRDAKAPAIRAKTANHADPTAATFGIKNKLRCKFQNPNCCGAAGYPVARSLV